MPKLPTGDYKLVVATTSALGEEKLERDVKVKAEPKILLVTDKPLYQPGQMIHIRALCLQSLRPDARSAAPPLTFEVEDAKGNKVFKQHAEDLATSASPRSTSSWPTRSTWATTTSGPMIGEQQAAQDRRRSSATSCPSSRST